jgi:hypothetical protein
MEARMARSGKGKQQAPPKPDEGRHRTQFSKTRQFDKAVKGMGKTNAAAILAQAQKFEREWRTSATNDDLSGGFAFKQLDARPGSYRVCQIYAGSDYRLAVTFIISGARAYWVHAWKKTRMNNRTETELAKKRAKSLWATLQQEGKGA